MSAIIVSPTFVPAPAHEALESEAVDLLSFDDLELEQALRAVSWNARDVSHFLRSSRATEARAAF
jgi:hypothetical protein